MRLSAPVHSAPSSYTTVAWPSGCSASTWLGVRVRVGVRVGVGVRARVRVRVRVRV